MTETKKRTLVRLSETEHTRKKQRTYKLIQFPSEADEIHDCRTTTLDGNIYFPSSISIMYGHSVERKTDTRIGLQEYFINPDAKPDGKSVGKPDNKWNHKREDVNEYFNAIYHTGEKLLRWVEDGDACAKARALRVAHDHGSLIYNELKTLVQKRILGESVLNIDAVNIAVGAGCDMKTFASAYMSNGMTAVYNSDHKEFWSVIRSLDFAHLDIRTVVDKFISVVPVIDNSVITDIGKRIINGCKADHAKIVAVWNRKPPVKVSLGDLLGNLGAGSTRHLLSYILANLDVCM